MRRVGEIVVGVLAAVLVGGCAGHGRSADASAVFAHAAVAADHPLASAAGARILRQGGNAVDAAVATALTLSVVRPYSCGIGGGGFMVIHLRDDPRFGTLDVVINARETSPAAVDAAFFERDDDTLASRYGAKAVAVPGTVAGLLDALETYGTLDRAAVFAPAIEAARDGFLVDAHYADAAASTIKRFEQHPGWDQRFPFVWDRFLGGGRIAVGDRVSLPEQARALELIARDGRSAFYEGPIADAITDAIARDGGVLDAGDLARYEAGSAEPIRSRFFGYAVLGMPPPSSGGIAVAQILGILQRRRIDLEPAQWEGPTWLERETPARLHLMIEAFKHAFADRSAFLADPAFVEVPVGRLLDPAYLDALAARVDPLATAGPGAYGSAGLGEPIPDDAGTSHFCVVDAHGSAVSCTQTINLAFGSLVAVEPFGFVLNDEMDDFTTHRGQANAFGLIQSDRNLPAPGKRPLSSMSPTIVLDADGRVVALAGASGGPRIITGTAQVLLRVLVDDAPAAVAVTARRYHHQWLPDVVRVETVGDGSAGSASAGVLGVNPGLLTTLGHEVEPIKSVGEVQLIRRVPGGWDATSDPRKGGSPAGY